jgi:phosphate transport system permease protein
MASGNAAVLDASPTSSARTITATIASELGETARGSEHFRVLFLLGAVLFLITLAFDQLGVRTKRWLARRLGNEEAPCGETPYAPIGRSRVRRSRARRRCS